MKQTSAVRLLRSGVALSSAALLAGQSARARLRLPAYVLALLTSVVLPTGQVARANTQDSVNSGSTDLTMGTSYSGGSPTNASDVTFTNQMYTATAFTLDSSLSIGTLDDLDTTTQALTVQNTSGSADTLTLNGGANSVSGTAADLLYVASGGSLSLGGGSGNAALNITLAASGNFDVAGTATISSAISGAGFALNKTGAGTLTLAGNGTSTLGASTLNGTILNLGAGTTIFGIASTDAPTLNILGSGNSVGVFLDTGSFTMANGMVSTTTSQGLVIAGSQTYTQTGGTFSASGLIEFANNGGSSVVNISGGTLTDTSSRIELAIRGNSTTTLSGTGAINTPSLVMTTSQLSGGAAGSTFNLNGGTLTTGTIIPGTNGTTGTGTIFNFNGGTLTSSATSTTFMTGLTTANVMTGGAIINTSTFNDTIGQALLNGGGTDGGLTKQGGGTLTLTGANTYNGGTTISAGTLQVGNATALGASTGAVSVSSGAVLDLFGTTMTNTNALTLNGTGITSGGALINSSATSATYAGPITVGAGSGSGTTGSPYTASIIANSGALITTGAISDSNAAGNDTLTLGGTGTAGNDLQSTLTDNGGYGLIINKIGAGTWTLGGSGTSPSQRGGFSISAGTLNFGSATETPSFTTTNAPSGNGGLAATLYITGGNFSMVNGTLSLSGGASSGLYGLYDIGSGNVNVSGGTLTLNPATNSGQGIILNSNTYSQTGGAVSTNGIIEFANSAGSTTTMNVSAGSLTTTSGNANDATDMAVRGTTTFTLSGTGTFTTPVLNMSTSQIASGAATSTFNLNGGTLVTNTIIDGTGGSTGTQTFNFNGGTLKASTAGSATFLTGLTAANVRSGGAFINTNGFNDTIGQALLTGTSMGIADGGLTKLGGGILTLAAANTYTGATTISAGGLTIAANGGLSTGNVTLAASTTLTLGAGVTAAHSNTTSTLTLTNATDTVDLAATTGTVQDTVGRLVIGGVTELPGLYGSSTSGAPALDQLPEFTGSGELLVLVPEPSTWAVLGAGLAMLLAGRGLRRRSNA
jgi:autotransporter-associated beta strand protein